MSELKTCCQCKKDKPIDEFFRDSSKPDGRSYLCKQCKTDKVLQKSYGITLEEYNKQVKRQNGECAMCHKKSKLVIDHDHFTGSFRGLLCNTCNRYIGLIGDNPILALEAAHYLVRCNARGINWSNLCLDKETAK